MSRVVRYQSTDQILGPVVQPVFVLDEESRRASRSSRRPVDSELLAPPAPASVPQGWELTVRPAKTRGGQMRQPDQELFAVPFPQIPQGWQLDERPVYRMRRPALPTDPETVAPPRIAPWGWEAFERSVLARRRAVAVEVELLFAPPIVVVVPRGWEAHDAFPRRARFLPSSDDATIPFVGVQLPPASPTDMLWIVPPYMNMSQRVPNTVSAIAPQRLVILPGENDVYAMDFTQRLVPAMGIQAAETIASVTSVVAKPITTPPLSIGAPAISGSQVQIPLGGPLGLGQINYLVEILIHTSLGRDKKGLGWLSLPAVP